jgi:diguanylate cyclase (GGDEF)-like protein
MQGWLARAGVTVERVTSLEALEGLAEDVQGVVCLLDEAEGTVDRTVDLIQQPALAERHLAWVACGPALSLLGVLQLMRAGVDDYVTLAEAEAIFVPAVEQALKKRARRQQIDALTGVPNRRAFRHRLQREISRAERYRHPLSLVFVDVDRFKLYNDRHGHPAGDQLLIALADLLCRSVRDIDVVARCGGDEFALILPETNAAGARPAVERLLQTIRDYPFPHTETQPTGQLTCRAGVCCFPDDAKDWVSLVEGAAEALEQARAAGRGCVQVLLREERRVAEDA